MEIKVFKKEEPTFDPNRLEEEDAWRVYVTDYLSTAPTTGTRMSAVRTSVLRRNLSAASQVGTNTPSVASDDPPNPLARRFDLVKAKENLEFKISIEDRKIFFDKEKAEYFIQPALAREGGKEGSEDAEATDRYRDDTLTDTQVINNGAMKGLSKEDVEGKNRTYAALLAGGVSGGDVDKDNKMEE